MCRCVRLTDVVNISVHICFTLATGCVYAIDTEINIYVCAYAYIYMYMYMYMYMRMYMYMYPCIYVCVCVCICIYIYIYACMHVYVYMYICITPAKKWGDTEIAERGRSVLVMRARYKSAGWTPHQRGWTDAG